MVICFEKEKIQKAVIVNTFRHGFAFPLNIEQILGSSIPFTKPAGYSEFACTPNLAQMAKCECKQVVRNNVITSNILGIK